MKKTIIIDVGEKQQKPQKRIIHNKIFEWLLYMICYTVVLITVDVLFKSLNISHEGYILYPFLASIIIYILNQTIKPVLFFITLPLTALSWGLFYPIINVIVLYLTSFILGSKFELHGFIIPFFIAILISFLNILMEGIVIKPIIRKGRNNNG